MQEPSQKARQLPHSERAVAMAKQIIDTVLHRNHLERVSLPGNLPDKVDSFETDLVAYIEDRDMRNDPLEQNLYELRVMDFLKKEGIKVKSKFQLAQESGNLA
jgi:hypothetical protein